MASSPSNCATASPSSEVETGQKRTGRLPSDRVGDALALRRDVEAAFDAYCGDGSFCGWRFGIYSASAFEQKRGKSPDLDVLAENLIILQVALKHFPNGKVLNDDLKPAVDWSLDKNAAANPARVDVSILGRFLTNMIHKMVSHVKDLVKYEDRYKYRLNRASADTRWKVRSLMNLVKFEGLAAQEAITPPHRIRRRFLSPTRSLSKSHSAESIEPSATESGPSVQIPKPVPSCFLTPEIPTSLSEPGPVATQLRKLPACFLIPISKQELTTEAIVETPKIRALPACFGTSKSRSKRVRSDAADAGEDVHETDLDAEALACKPVSAKKGARKQIVQENKKAKKDQKQAEELKCSLGKIVITHCNCRASSYICTRAVGQKPRHVVSITEKQTVNYVDVIKATAEAMAKNDFTKQEAVTFARDLASIQDS